MCSYKLGWIRLRKYEVITQEGYSLDETDIVFFSMEAGMRKVKDNPVELPHFEISVKPHSGSIHSVQKGCTQQAQFF